FGVLLLEVPFMSQCARAQRDLLSFPTRRSSDLSKVGTGPWSFKRNWGFEPQTLSYEFRLKRCEQVPQRNPLNPKYRLLIALWRRSEEHTSELQSRENLVCRPLLEKKKWTRPRAA